MRLTSSKIKKKGEYSSIGRATVCGTVGSLFKSGYSPSVSYVIYIARIV